MKIKTWQIIALIVSLVLGVILHFTYEWSVENTIVGIFSAVNESTWEHLKLAFFPMLLMAIIGYFIIGKQSENYWLAQSIGIITAMLFIITFFYTYTGVIGKNIDILNIGSFFVGVILGEIIIYKILKSTKIYDANAISIIFLIILLFSFILYTFYPPQIGIFKDPISGNYGIQRLT